MTYTDTEGDLLSLGLPAIGHGCNCAGSMRRGIARQIRDRYPAMHAEYQERCRRGTFRLGEIFVWEADDVVVYNLATQQHSGPDARLDAIDASVRAALTDAHARGLRTLGLPRIGSGIGGLAWADVSAILRQAASESTVDLTIAHPAAHLGAAP